MSFTYEGRLGGIKLNIASERPLNGVLYGSDNAESRVAEALHNLNEVFAEQHLSVQSVTLVVK